MKNFFLFVSGLLIFCLLAGGGFVAYEAHRFLNTPASQTPEDVIISIAPGAAFDRVAWDLKKAGAITDVSRFRLLAQLKDALGKVKAGEFMVNTGWTPEQVLAQITEGRAVLYRLTLREGLTWWETAKAVEAQGFATYEDFKAVIHDPAFLKEHNIPFANAEGFLFPETYLMNKPRSPLDREQAREVAVTMVRMFWKKTEPLWAQLSKQGENGALGGASPAPGAMRSPPPVRPLAPVRDGQGDGMDSASGHNAGNAAQRPLPTIPADLTPSASQANQSPSTSAQTITAPVALPTVSSAGATPTASASGTTLPPDGALPPTSPDGTPRASEQPEKSSTPLPDEPLPATIPSETPAPTVGAATPSAPKQAAVGNGGVTGPPDAAPAAPPAPGQGVTGNGATAGPAASVPSAPDADEPRTPAEVDPDALRRLIILASLVEKETGVPSERGLVAGVYVNRLRLGMLLQCDPTIIYGVGESFTGAIRRSQLDDAKNLYNTYQHPGLPPGPICSSGLASLKAAFAPMEHDYLYFVATGIDAGHTFSKTLAEHNRAVQVYRARMRGEK